MKKIVWMACGMALMCAPLSASANVRYDDPQEKVQKKEVPNPEKAAQRRIVIVVHTTRKPVER